MLGQLGDLFDRLDQAKSPGGPLAEKKQFGYVLFFSAAAVLPVWKNALPATIVYMTYASSVSSSAHVNTTGNTNAGDFSATGIYGSILLTCANNASVNIRVPVPANTQVWVNSGQASTVVTIVFEV